MSTIDSREPLADKDTNKSGSKIPQSASKLRPPRSIKKPNDVRSVDAAPPPPMTDLGPTKKRPSTSQPAAPASKRPRLERSNSSSRLTSVDDNFTGRIPSKPTNDPLSGRPSTIACRAISGRPVGSATATRPTRNTTGLPPPKPSSSVRHTSRPTSTTSNRSSTLNRSGASSRATTSGLNRSSSASSLKSTTSSKSGSAAPKSTVPSVGDAPRSKRPAWDLKGRLQDLEQLLYGKSSQLKENTERLGSLNVQNEELSCELDNTSLVNKELDVKVKELGKVLRQTEDDFQVTKRRLERDLEDAVSDKSRVERQRDTLDGELKAAMTQVAGLKSAVAEMSASQAGIKSQYDATKVQLEGSQEFGRQKVSEIKDLKSRIEGYETETELLNHKCRAHETERRKLHNTIQELKGNIRVFCRVRPFIQSELANDQSTMCHIQFPDTDCKEIELDNLNSTKVNDTKNNRHLFKFDYVFAPESTQSYVFEEISQLVQSALDGYNVCIFAYGQTGSGKTFTMEGPHNPDPVTEGTIPRAVQQIFISADLLKDNGWQYEFEASFLEIYNETLRDLLGDGDPKVKHDIKMVNSKTNELMVTNQTLVTVTSPQQVASLLKKASENRAVAETKMNERSSRSHSVFTLKMRGYNSMTTETCEGTLNLVDLAGSERLKDSGSQGARLKETLAINSSLSNLGNVIMALGNKESHIPYRNSKLTYLLQNSLGGNSKTLMFVNVSPKEEHLNETVNSLRFAAKVNSCNIGTAQKKIKA